MTHNISSSKKLGTTHSLQKKHKKEMYLEEVFEDTWLSKKDEWIHYKKNDVLCTDFGYPRYIRRIQKITGFGMRSNLTSPSLGFNFFYQFES